MPTPDHPKQDDGSTPSPTDRQRAAHQWRLRVYPIAVLAVLFVVVLWAAASDDGPTESGHLGGDYPAFYGAGSLAGDGDWDRLYEGAAQQEAQSGLISDGGFLYFAYPPPVAGLYAPLAAIDYRWSYAVHTLLMAVALGVAVRLSRPLSPFVDRYPIATYAVLLLTYPLWRAVSGGQNSALTLLLVVAALHFERSERPVASGIAVGLMLYKPQFGLVFVLLLLIRRRWRAALSAGAVGLAIAGFSTIVLGFDWLDDWLRPATDFARLNADLNSANLISIPGALDHTLGATGRVLGWLAAGALAAVVAGIWWRRTDLDPSVGYAMAAGTAVLALPQPLFYELGLLAPAAMLLAVDTRALKWVVAAAAASWVHTIGAGTGGLGSMLLALVLLGALLRQQRLPAGRVAAS